MCVGVFIVKLRLSADVLFNVNKVPCRGTELKCFTLATANSTKVLIRAASLQIAFTFVVYPSLILAYMGQAAYLSKHHVIQGDYHIGFYVSVPGKYFAPLFDSLFFSFLFLFVHLNAACISSLNISTNLYVHHCPRKTAVSCSGYCYTCCSGWKPGHHHWDVFHNQAMLCFRLLPKGQNSTYIV